METEYVKDWRHGAQGLISLSEGNFLLRKGVDEESTLLTVGGSYFLIDGAIDLITGYHHYCFQRTVDLVKYVNKTLRNN